jgi:cell wall-associated NlpC family hydrolase
VDSLPSLGQTKSSKLPTRNDVIRVARTYLGSRHVHIGRSKEHGVDCIGLVVGVAKELGLSYHDVQAYSKRPDGHSLIREFDFAFLPCEQPLPGDIVVFWISRPELPTHAGILTDYGVIHTHAGIGRVVEHTLDNKWIKRIHRHYCYPNLDPSWQQSHSS